MNGSLITSWRIFKAGVKNFFRNAWLASAAIAVMFVTLTIIVSSIVVNRILQDNVNLLSKEVTVSIFLRPDVSEADTNALQSELNDRVEEIDILFVSQDQALADFQETFQEDEELLEGIDLGDNPLPSSLTVSIVDLSNIGEIVSIAGQPEFEAVVEDTSDSGDRRESIQNIERAQDFITLFSIVSAGIFAFISVLIIFNTIRMAIFTRSEEIGIMKLVGATRGYIRGPFVLESMLYGFIASLLSLAAIYVLLFGILSNLDRSFLIAPLDESIAMFKTLTGFLYISGGTILTGLLLGAVSSRLALQRYMKLSDW